MRSCQLDCQCSCQVEGNQAHVWNKRNATEPTNLCHSERSEESAWNYRISGDEYSLSNRVLGIVIPNFVRNDKGWLVLVIQRALFSYLSWQPLTLHAWINPQLLILWLSTGRICCYNGYEFKSRFVAVATNQSCATPSMIERSTQETERCRG